MKGRMDSFALFLWYSTASLFTQSGVSQPGGFSRCPRGPQDDLNYKKLDKKALK